MPGRKVFIVEVVLYAFFLLLYLSKTCNTEEGKEKIVASLEKGENVLIFMVFSYATEFHKR